MILEIKEIKKILLNDEMKKGLKKFKVMKDVIDVDYSSLSEDERGELSDSIFQIMTICAPIRVIFASYFDDYPNDCELYGVRGFYILYYPNDMIYTKFTNLKNALKEANATSRMFRELYLKNN